jgi:adenosylcobinamide-GDP ribazoletransferase
MGLAADALLATFAAVLIGLLTGAVVWRWARPSLGGVNGDVLGATIELARVAALHAGVVVWTGL